MSADNAQAPVAGATGLAAQPAAASPDPRTMTPVEQFDQLFNRVMLFGLVLQGRSAEQRHDGPALAAARRR